MVVRKKTRPKRLSKPDNDLLAEILEQGRKFQEINEMEEEWMWLTDLDQIRLRAVARSMCFQIRGDTDSLDADLQQLLDIKEILRSPLEATYCISDDRRVVLEICAQNKMARALAGPVFLDKLKRQVLVFWGGKCHTVYVASNNWDCFEVEYAMSAR